MARKISFRSALQKFLLSAEQPFKMHDLLTFTRTRARTEPEYLEESAHRLLTRDPLVFYDEVEKSYIPRRSYFKGARFRVVPLEDEIESGILFVGHRLTPFCAPRPDFAHCSLYLPDGAKVRTRKVARKPADLLIYHTLLGMERMYVWILGNDPRNISNLIEQPSAETEVRVAALDLRTFYREHNFRPGDALVFTVLDWSDSKCSVELAPRTRDQAAVKKWNRAFANGLREVLRQVPFSNLPEQLARAFFYGGEYLLHNPVLNTGAFFAESEEFDFIETGTGPVLACTAGDNDETVGEPSDDGAPTFIGDADTLEEILEDIGLPIPASTFEAYMRDALYDGTRDLHQVVKRSLVSFRPIHFYDDYQMKAFQLGLEELWEQVLAQYSRTTDHYGGKCRTVALRALDKLQTALNEKESGEEQLEVGDALAGLLSAARQLHWILGSLNSGDSGGKPLNQGLLPEVQHLAEEVSRLAAELQSGG